MKNKEKDDGGGNNLPSIPDDALDTNPVEMVGDGKHRNSPRGNTDACPGLKAFQQEFLILCDPLSPSGVSMGAYIRRNLRQFHVTDHSEFDVLGIVYLRAYKFLKAGGTQIVYPIAWTKRTSYNVIRELNRRPSNSKEFSLDSWLLDKKEPDLGNQEASHKTDIEILKHALALLTPKEWRLLTLKVVHELRWNEIREILLQDGEVIPGFTPEKQEASLRKMKERALKHLRSSYHALRPLSELEED